MNQSRISDVGPCQTDPFEVRELLQVDEACIGNPGSEKGEMLEAGQLAEFGQAGIRDCEVSVPKLEKYVCFLLDLWELNVS